MVRSVSVDTGDTFGPKPEQSNIVCVVLPRSGPPRTRMPYFWWYPKRRCRKTVVRNSRVSTSCTKFSKLSREKERCERYASSR